MNVLRNLKGGFLKNVKVGSEGDRLRDSWAGLGIAYETSRPIKNADPEQVLIQSLSELDLDRRLLRLMLLWLQEYGSLVHVERLKSLADELSTRELAWLGGVAIYCSEKFGDNRWSALAKAITKKLGKKPAFETSRLDHLQAQKNGKDPAFFSFGLLIPIVLTDDSQSETRKILPRIDVIKKNPWFRLRMLMGTNWRADTASAMVQGLASNSYQAEQLLGCSRETAHRNWKALKEVDAEEILSKVS